jgi:DNA end-binding protein Ku
MRRAIWSGSIRFGLVNIPVKLFSAVSQKEVRFHMLHDDDGAKIHLKRVCSAEDVEVPYEHIVKGFEIEKGRYVTTTTEELRALAPEDTHGIDLEEFVDLREIDPVFYEHTYYVTPDRSAGKAYALLLRAMTDADRVGIGRVVIRTKQYLCAIRPMPDVIALSTMTFADEILPASELEGLPTKSHKPSAKEVAMATQLIGALSTEFDPSKYEDTFRERVLGMLEKKAKGQAIEPPPSRAEKVRAVDLVSALKKSLSHAKLPAREPRRPAKARRRAHKKAA